MKWTALYTVDRENFTLKIVCLKNFLVVKFSRFRLICEFFLTVDDYNMDGYWESQGLLAVVVDQTFIPGSVDIGCCSVSLAVGCDREITLTAKFSQSTVMSKLTSHLERHYSYSHTSTIVGMIKIPSIFTDNQLECRATTIYCMSLSCHDIK